MAIIKYMQVLFIINTVINKEKIEITWYILDIFYALIMASVINKEKIEITWYILDIFYALIMASVINKEKIESIKFKFCIYCI